MNAYCPECETELDVTTGICPACRWDPLMVRPTVRPVEDDGMSLTERYRGTRFDISTQQAAVEDHGGSRSRLFIGVSLLAAVMLYGGAMSAMGLF
jgi:hypothetical protein